MTRIVVICYFESKSKVVWLIKFYFTSGRSRISSSETNKTILGDFHKMSIARLKNVAKVCATLDDEAFGEFSASLCSIFCGGDLRAPIDVVEEDELVVICIKVEIGRLVANLDANIAAAVGAKAEFAGIKEALPERIVSLFRVAANSRGRCPSDRSADSLENRLRWNVWQIFGVEILEGGAV